MAKIDVDKLASKIAGHSYYHGDRILSAIFCMAEGKEVGNVKPTNVYDKDVDMGRSIFSQRRTLAEEYREWLETESEQLRKESSQNGFRITLAEDSIMNMK